MRLGLRRLAEDGAQKPEREADKARRLGLLLTLRRAHDERGRWPEAWEWEFATEAHVWRRTYVRHFGSWDAACRAAAKVRP